MPRSAYHAFSVVPLLLLSAAGAGCERTAAGGLSPDFAGTWDVTYDDSMDFELRYQGQVQRAQLGELGGQFALRDAGAGVEIDVDCTRPELVCPSEVWPREYAMEQAPGQVDGEGLQLARAIVGEGQGRCATLPGSFLVGEVASVASPSSVRQEAVALTSGRITTVLDATCFAPFAGLPSGTQVVLTTGFTAAKR